MMTSDTAARYAAFISYSHKDAAVARALHRQLERYRVPRRLAGTDGEHGPVPRRLTPIFRDRDELPAASDLSEKVRMALATSACLIVLCSPHAAASLWVASEIEGFRELNPGRPILAAIVDGDPDVCFPPALSAAVAGRASIEPLAADLRRSGDGRRLGFLKLVAGIAGVGLDALIQRDAARQIRSVTTVTVVAIATALVMTVLTITALHARHEAEAQRGKAEGLVEFMLTDLRTEMRGSVGQLRVLDIVNKRALEYYGGQQSLGDLPDDSLERRARILQAMGEDDIARGDMNAALQRFREAYAATAATLSRHTDDPKAIFAHAQSEYWIGRVYELSEDWRNTAIQYDRYAAAAERLITIAPGNPDYMMERGWGSLDRGIAADGLQNGVAAEKLYRDAADWFAKASRARPRDQTALSELANAYGWLADSLLARKLPMESLAARQQQYQVALKRYQANSTSPQLTFELAVAERGVARLSAMVGDTASAATLSRSAYARAIKLVAGDPRNAEWLLLKTKLECDALGDNSLGIAAGTLRQSVAGAVARFKAQQNPRLSEISKCVQRWLN